ncbi:MAG: hypothetical protein CMR00_04130 [[Chlorobium] sp. 445]|nr:MAG: hypothetical protein CMR00_04130 [[Chlorobium] sp. 445]
MKTASHAKQDAKSELAIVVGFLVLFVIFQKMWLLYLACGLGVVFLGSENLSRFILAVWFKFAQAIGYINTRLLLSLVYVGVLWPVALLRRLTQPDPLWLKAPPRETMFKTLERSYEKKDFEKLW